MDAATKWRVLCKEMERSFPVLASVWTQAPKRFGSEWLPEAVKNFEAMYGVIESTPSPRILDALEGYAEFSNDSMRNQVFYERHGRYEASNYEEVREQMYWNEE